MSQMSDVWIITPLIDHHYSSTHLLSRHLFSRHLTQGTERAVLQTPRQTLGVERVRARQPAGAGRVHRGHADAAGRVIVSAIKKRIFQVEADSKTRDLSLRREYNTKLRQHRHAQSSALGGGGGHDGSLEIAEIPEEKIDLGHYMLKAFETQI